MRAVQYPMVNSDKDMQLECSQLEQSLNIAYSQAEKMLAQFISKCVGQGRDNLVEIADDSITC